ncbi:MAG TPA: phospholipase D-like domain-containing protein [Blastocatellia bacterium]|nr:phospholipase D-like domain-containing protein [Blastocatellia bacterium]
MKLLVQPGDGIAPLLAGIRSARRSIEIVIFRLDLREIEVALKAAVARGVKVQALVAYTSRNGERSLRKLEQRLLDCGATVTRTADDLVRYHDKFMIIDRRVLYLFAFNYTAIDIRHSRSFGIITRNRQLVQEAVKLFEADVTRQTYTPALSNFLVSPLNARRELAAFIRGARKKLLIYDTQISDREMIKLLQSRAKAGVEIRVIGNLSKPVEGVTVQKLRGLRLHTRTIIRDGHQAFIGSQSLRRAELDKRRELGLIVREPKVVRRLLDTFEADWEGKEIAAAQPAGIASAARAAQKAIKAVASDLPSLAPEVSEAVISAFTGTIDEIDEIPESEQVAETVKEAVIVAVKETVRDVVAEAVKEAVQGVKDAA